MTEQNDPKTESARTGAAEATPETPKAGAPRKALSGRRLAFAGAAVGLLAIGGGVGATAVAHMRPTAEMAPATPVAISRMADDSIVTVKGSVAEIFGNKFVLADDSGRALIETGRAGEDGKLVKPSEQVTVQGRFDDGFVKAAFLVRADGKVERIGGFGPKHGPHWGPGHWRGAADGGPAGDGPAGPGPRGPEGRL